MSTVTEEQNTTRTDAAHKEESAAVAPQKSAAPSRARAGRSTRTRRTRRPRERARQEYEQQIISIRRVTRVVAGGRRFSFSVAIVLGNRKGKVGVGLGKGADTALAIEKAVRNAKRNLIAVPLTEQQSIPHEMRVKYAASEVYLYPTKGGGLRAGSSVRTVLELAGVKNATAKIFSRSKNRLNNARAAALALSRMRA